jgi:hypothetical protein
VSGVTVVVDFGATDTVGVQRGRGEAPRPVVVDGETSVPSAVALSPEDQLVVGREAVRVGTAEPDRAVAELKNRLDRHDVMVGDLVLPVARLVRTLLSRVVRSTGTAVDELVLTHPAGWPPERVEVLTRAASGLAPSVRTVLSPLAAAAGAELEPDQTLLVVELDGDAGTATAIRRKSGKFSVLSSADLPADGNLATVEPTADVVLVVGRSSRTTPLARRLAEQGRPVHVDPDPTTAVARGALRLLDQLPARSLRPGRAGRAASVRPATAGARGSGRLWLRRSVVGAAGVVLVAAIAAVLTLGWGPGLRMAGSPGPVAGALVDSEGGLTIPPPVDGQEMVSAGQPAFAAARVGAPASYRGAGGVELAITVKRARPATRLAALGGPAPAGYRWLVVELTGTNTGGPDWKTDLSRSVSLVDDRGLRIRPLGDGVVPCTATTPKPPKVLARGKSFTGCVALPVPERTPVVAAVFGSGSDEDGATPPIRVPVVIPAVTNSKPAPANVVGKAGDPPDDVAIGDATMRAGFDVVRTPSGYLGKVRPEAGNRFVVVRAALGPADDVFLRDDRGVLVRAQPGFDRMPDCPPFTGPGTAEHPVFACFVYELDADSVVAGVTYADVSADAPVSGKDIERWPTWTAV